MLLSLPALNCRGCVVEKRTNGFIQAKGGCTTYEILPSSVWAGFKQKIFIIGMVVHFLHFCIYHNW